MKMYKINKPVSFNIVELYTKTHWILNRRNRMLLSLVSLGCYVWYWHTLKLKSFRFHSWYQPPKFNSVCLSINLLFGCTRINLEWREVCPKFRIIPSGTCKYYAWSFFNIYSLNINCFQGNTLTKVADHHT